jgi:hypothetical protein
MLKRCFRAIALLLIATMLVVSMSRPARADNDDTTTAIIIVGGVIGGLVIVALIGTLIVYNRKDDIPREYVARNPLPDEGRKQGLRVGPACAPSSVDGQVPMFCW